MKKILILGAGFAGLELATRLSEEAADAFEVTLIDRNDSFGFGFAKLALMFGRKSMPDVRMSYSDIAKDGVEFRQESVTAIDPEAKRVTTDRDTYDADVLVIALGADYDLDATPGLKDAGHEYYSFAGAERMWAVIPKFESGRIVIAILGQPFKCPPAPFEAALLLHDYLTDRGTRDLAEIQVLGPMAAPVPITKEVSGQFLTALGERDIPYGAQQVVTGVDGDAKEAKLANGESVPFDLFIGIPIHRVPEVVESSGLAEDGWIPVDLSNLMTKHQDVYAVGDCAAAQTAKAGVFAESAAGVVADDIIARARGTDPPASWQGDGHCYLEFGGGKVGKVEANFLGGPKPTAELVGPSTELAAEKREFAAARQARWFG